MAKEGRLKVKLISYTRDAEQTAVAAIRQCYAAVGEQELKKKTDEATKKRLIVQVMGSGHTSTLEHVSFTFAIEGLSRVSEVQLVRHRVGTAFSIQSGRYVKRKEAKFTIPESVKKAEEKLRKKYLAVLDGAQELYEEMLTAGIAAQDARYIQPQSLQVKMVVTMNARELLHFLELRLCERAQWEIRELAAKMLGEARKVAPTILANAGPSCVTQGICWEGDLSCGRWEKLGGEKRSRN